MDQNLILNKDIKIIKNNTNLETINYSNTKKNTRYENINNHFQHTNTANLNLKNQNSKLD